MRRAEYDFNRSPYLNIMRRMPGKLVEEKILIYAQQIMLMDPKLHGFKTEVFDFVMAQLELLKKNYAKSFNLAKYGTFEKQMTEWTKKLEIINRFWENVKVNLQATTQQQLDYSSKKQEVINSIEAAMRNPGEAPDTDFSDLEALLSHVAPQPEPQAAQAQAAQAAQAAQVAQAAQAAQAATEADKNGQKDTAMDFYYEAANLLDIITLGDHSQREGLAREYRGRAAELFEEQLKELDSTVGQPEPELEPHTQPSTKVSDELQRLTSWDEMSWFFDFRQDLSRCLMKKIRKKKCLNDLKKKVEEKMTELQERGGASLEAFQAITWLRNQCIMGSQGGGIIMSNRNSRLRSRNKRKRRKTRKTRRSRISRKTRKIKRKTRKIRTKSKRKIKRRSQRVRKIRE